MKNIGSNIINKKALNIFYFDLRSLAFLRICLALITIVDLFVKFNSIKTNYSDHGILTRTDLIDKTFNSPHWSIHLLTGSVLGQQLLFLFTLFWAILLLIGYRTKLAIVICWLMLVSLQNRNPIIVTDFDGILATVFFWGMFLPLGGMYSFDRALNTSIKILPQSIISGGTIGLIIQLYFFSILIVEQYLFNQHVLPELFKIGILFLILIAWQYSLARLIMIASWAIISCIQGFSILNVIWLALIPSTVWGYLYNKKYCQESSGLTINYDRDCGFCKKVVYLLRTFLILPEVSLLEAQNNPSVYADMEKYNSWVVEDYWGNRYFKWRAIVYLASISPILWLIVPVLRLKPLMLLGNKIYEFIATHRSLMGNLTKPFLFRSLRIKSSIFSSFLAIFFISLMVTQILENSADNAWIKHRILENIIEITKLSILNFTNY